MYMYTALRCLLDCEKVGTKLQVNIGPENGHAAAVPA